MPGIGARQMEFILLHNLEARKIFSIFSSASLELIIRTAASGVERSECGCVKQ